MSRFCRLRNATPDDIFFIRSLEMDPANIFVHSWDNETHTKNMADPSIHYLIAEGLQGTALGFAILVEAEPGCIEWRRVVVARRDDGIGSEFMRAVIKQFRDAGAHTIWLDVYKENTRARHVYASLGFKEIRREPLVSDPSVTLVIMELSLGP